MCQAILRDYHLEYRTKGASGTKYLLFVDSRDIANFHIERRFVVVWQQGSIGIWKTARVKSNGRPSSSPSRCPPQSCQQGLNQTFLSSSLPFFLPFWQAVRLLTRQPSCCMAVYIHLATCFGQHYYHCPAFTPREGVIIHIIAMPSIYIVVSRTTALSSQVCVSPVTSFPPPAVGHPAKTPQIKIDDQSTPRCQNLSII